MANDPFRIFYLPFVVLFEIFKELDPQEVLRLAMCSKRSYKLSKSVKNKRRKLVLMVKCDTEGAIRIRRDENEEIDLFSVAEFADFDPTEIFDFLISNGIRFPYKEDITYENSLDIYSPMDRFEGIKTLSEYVSELFDLPIHKLIVSGEHNVNDPRRCIDWIMSRQEALEECWFTFDGANEREIEHFLDTCRITKIFNLTGQPNDDFRYRFNRPMELEHIEIFDAKWPTIENLFELNSRFLGMPNTEFTGLEINRFLKNWLNGGNSKLQLISVGIAPMTIQDVVNGIEVTMRNHINSIEYFFSEEHPLIFDHSFDVLREDGVLGSILFDMHEPINPFITLAVWPDWRGRQYPAINN